MDDGAFSDFEGGNDLPAGVERRASGRHRAICRIARVLRDRDAGFWRVRNISDDGMQLAADVEARIGERLEISLSETIVVVGHIIWANRGRFGVALEARIDAAAVLRALAADQRAAGYRALRLPVAAEAILVIPTGCRPIDLVDISPQGAGYRCDMQLETGSEVELILPGSDLRRRALVRWVQGSRGGLWFTQALERTDLESIARFGASTPHARPAGALGGILSRITILGAGRMAKAVSAFYKSRIGKTGLAANGD